MFILQLTSKAENAIYDPSKQQKPPKPIDRQVKRSGVFPTTFEGAEEKLRLAGKMHEWRMGALDAASGITYQERISGKKSWDKEEKEIESGGYGAKPTILPNRTPAAVLLEKMGYEDGKQELLNLQLDERFSKARFEASVAIAGLKKTYDAAKKELDKTSDPAERKALELLMNSLAYAANAAAAMVLKEEEKYILWAAGAWAKSDPQKIKSVFYHLVDANSYLTHESMAGFYNLKYESGGNEEYVTDRSHPALEQYYSYLGMSKKFMDERGRDGKYNKLVENYAYNLEKFDSHFKNTVEKETSWFEHSKKIKEARTGVEKICAAAGPFVEGATPVVAALSMLSPYTCLVGYTYFTKASIDAFRAGEYGYGFLMAATTAAPVFGEMVGSGLGIVSTAGKVGSAISRGSGLIFQIDIGISTGMLLLDGAEYGLSVEQLAALEANLGFMMMPSMVRKASKKLAKTVPKKSEAKKEETAKKDINVTMADEAWSKNGQYGARFSLLRAAIEKSVPGAIEKDAGILQHIKIIAASWGQESVELLAKTIGREKSARILWDAERLEKIAEEGAAKGGIASTAQYARVMEQARAVGGNFYLAFEQGLGGTSLKAEELQKTFETARAYYEFLGDTKYAYKIISENLADLRPLDAKIARYKFQKTGSILIPLGGKQTGLMFRVISEESYQAWKAAYEAGVPCEEIVRSYERDGNQRAVVSKYAGPNLAEFSQSQQYTSSIEADVNAQKAAINQQLRELGIEHVHPAPTNYCVEMANGRPIVRIIDLDFMNMEPRESRPEVRFVDERTSSKGPKVELERVRGEALTEEKMKAQWEFFQNYLNDLRYATECPNFDPIRDLDIKTFERYQAELGNLTSSSEVAFDTFVRLSGEKPSAFDLIANISLETFEKNHYRLAAMAKTEPVAMMTLANLAEAHPQKFASDLIPLADQSLDAYAALSRIIENNPDVFAPSNYGIVSLTRELLFDSPSRPFEKESNRAKLAYRLALKKPEYFTGRQMERLRTILGENEAANLTAAKTGTQTQAGAGAGKKNGVQIGSEQFKMTNEQKLYWHDFKNLVHNATEITELAKITLEDAGRPEEAAWMTQAYLKMKMLTVGPDGKIGPDGKPIPDAEKGLSQLYEDMLSAPDVRTYEHKADLIVERSMQAETLFGQIIAKVEQINSNSQTAGLLNDVLEMKNEPQGGPGGVDWFEFMPQQRAVGAIGHEMKIERQDVGALIRSMGLETNVPNGQILAYADAALLKQAIGNVVGNARKYAKTIVEIEVRQNGGNVEILVRNDIREGGGLSPSQGINAFEGVRNENATAASTGVGLPASRGSMQKMGGDIYLLDGGKESGITVFALSIPQADLVLEAVDAGRKTKTEEEKKRTGRASARRAKKSGQKKDAPVQAPVQEQVKETRVLLLPDTNYFIKLFSQGMEVSQILKNLPPGSDFIVTRPVYDELVAMSSQNWRKGADGKPLVPGRAMAELQEAAYDGRITIFEVKVGEQDLQALSGRLKTLSDNNNSRLSAADASIVLAARELGDIYPNISPLSIDADVQILMMDWKKSRAQKQAP